MERISTISRRALLTAAPALGLGICATAPALAATVFRDVPSTNYFATEIQWMYTTGISTG